MGKTGQSSIAEEERVHGTSPERDPERVHGGDFWEGNSRLSVGHASLFGASVGGLRPSLSVHLQASQGSRTAS